MQVPEVQAYSTTSNRLFFFKETVRGHAQDNKMNQAYNNWWGKYIEPSVDI